jgi:hypothetical protein
LTLSGGNGTFEGDLTVGGKVTAQEFHTEFVSASIIYQSGSTKFGDTSDDVHSFSGSLRVTGSGDHYFTDGNVGIGTTSPEYSLDIGAENQDNPTDFIRLNPTNGNSDGTSNTLGTGLIWKPHYTSYTKRSAGIVQVGEGNFFRSGLAFYTNNTADQTTDWQERMRIDKDGNVGIGTTSPSTKLEVNGTATVTALVETSTRELKENIETLEDQSTIVDSLQPVSYTWKEDGKEDFGLIAEDVEEIAPHLVHRNEDGKPTGIKYSKLSVLLLDVVQKQNTLINDLNERITKLENERGE